MEIIYFYKGLMVFITTFNNISVISCMAFSFIGGGNRTTRPAASH